MIAQPDVWLRFNAQTAQSLHVDKSVKKALLTAALRYDFQAGSALRAEAEMEIKIPLRDATTFRCTTDAGGQNGVGFSSYIEEDPIRGKRTQWTPDPEGGLRCEQSGGEPTSGTTRSLPTSLVSPVLNPLLLIPALASSRKAGARSYGAYFVAGRRIYALYAQKQTKNPDVYEISICRVPDSPGIQWASMNWADAQHAELEWADSSPNPKELRASAPLIGTLRIELT
ncbi:MAG TPA: hypothetical protein VM432_01550 [Bdellovibrionales bacterium]|nr:hypothetical protein [Bdellovibrionales bacterium]